MRAFSSSELFKRQLSPFQTENRFYFIRPINYFSNAIINLLRSISITAILILYMGRKSFYFCL